MLKLPLIHHHCLLSDVFRTNGIPARPTASLDWNLHILEGDPKDKRASDAGRDGAVPTTHDAMRTAAAAVVQGAAKKVHLIHLNQALQSVT